MRGSLTVNVLIFDVIDEFFFSRPGKFRVESFLVDQVDQSS